MPHAAPISTAATMAGHERRTWAVAAINLAATVVLVTSGVVLASAAVLAEGLHTAAHVGAVVIAGVAYRVAARQRLMGRETAARRVGDAAGLANAVFLIAVAGVLAVESLGHLRHPAMIDVGKAVGLAVFGLIVNVASLAFLHHSHGHEHGHHRDLSFRAVYLHMIGDAAVGLLSIAGLLLVGAFGWRWADGIAGLGGAVLIAILAVQIMRAVFAVNPAFAPNGAESPVVVESP